MTGHVDERGRAILTLKLQHPENGASEEIDVCIDTGFNGKLMLTTAQMRNLALSQVAEAVGILADGSEMRSQVCECLLTWFDQTFRLTALIANGDSALLGTGLLDRCVLTIDYPARTVVIEQRPLPA